MKSKFIHLFKAAAKVPTAVPLREQIDRARALHLEKDHEEADHLYLSLLEAHPDNAEIHYRYGNLLKDQGTFDSALASYDRAIELKPDYAHAHCNRAVVLGLMSRPSDALESYQRAIELDPADSIARCNLAVLLIGFNRKDEALASFEAAISHDANNFSAHFGRGALLQERKTWVGSLAAYDRATAINPNDAPTHYNRGTVLNELKQWDEALRCCERAIALNPRFPQAYAKRGEILQELNQHSAALASFDRAIELNAGDATTFNNRGVLLQSMKRFKAALLNYDRAVALNPNHPEAWFNRGTVLKELDDLSGALASYDRAIAARPTYEAAYVNRGTALHDLGFFRDAVISYKHAITLKSDLPEAHYNLALASLAVGDYAEGWAQYEWRWRAKGGTIYREKRNFAEPLWLGGASISGKTILLYGEQGLGDSLQFSRYVELVAKLGARVILEVPAPLVKLFASLPGVERAIAYGDQLAHFDVQCPLMSLPLAFNTTLPTIPSNAGYLKSDPGKVAEWQLRLGAKTKPRIGLVWSGNQTAGTNRKRNIALSSFVPYLQHGVDYFCLQTEVVAADQEILAKTPKIHQFKGLLRDFTDTAALCACMDLVISVDTSVAHLAGALGKTTWVLLPFVPEWRWLTEREDSPWYGSVRLIRQKSAGDWHSVFERVAADLHVTFLRLSGS